MTRPPPNLTRRIAMTKAIQLHVSTSARGKADGSVMRPYSTLEAARDALRDRRRRGGLKAPVRVLIEPGVYRLERPLVFTPEDGGTAKCPVTWAGNGGRPLLSGARVVTGWNGGTINGRPCWQAVLPDVAAGRWWFTQLFVNGRRRLRARLPKQGFYRFTGVPAAEAKKDKGGHFHGAMSACFAPGEVRRFRDLKDIDVVVPDHWYDNHLRIESVDKARRVIRFATRGRSRFSRDETGRHARFRLDHVAEGCTEPGDWYLDRGTGTLSYIPMPGEEMAATQVEAPALDLLLSVQGDALDPAKRVRHLRFEFLDLRHADWELPRENPGAGQSAFNVPAAVRFVGAEDCALYACRVSQVGGWAVEVLRGCRRNRIVACALHDLGGGGVKIGPEGGLPKGWIDLDFRGMDAVALGWGPCREDTGGLLPGRDHAAASATTVSDCMIHDGGIIFHSAIGVWIGDASRNRIVHNHIWNFYYTGISCGWTWGYAPAFACDNRIEGNRIHDIGRGMLSDLGAIYVLGRQAGSTLRRNFISDVFSHGYGGHGIYTDEGTSWLRIEENIVCNTKSSGFNQHVGRDNVIRHNVFAEALEGSVRMLRCQMVRGLVFEGNLVQGAGTGALWRGEGCTDACIDRNVYATAPGRQARFADGSWEQWQAAGNDRHGRLVEAVMLDADGAAPAVANPAALKAAGITPETLAAVVTEAGPRFRGMLPPTLADIPSEPERRRPIVETIFWPWPACWPDAATMPGYWNGLPAAAAAIAKQEQTISLALENRGDAPARGRYRLRVVPSAAARIAGPKELNVFLKPGARTALDSKLVATGNVQTFRIEAVAEGDELITSCLFFTIVPRLKIPRLTRVPATANLAAALAELSPRAIAGNGSPVTATVRLAVTRERLLLRVDTADAVVHRGSNLWDGSSIELFVAPQPGAPHTQLIATPALGNEKAVAKLASGGRLFAADGVVIAGNRTAGGWYVALAAPLGLFNVAADAVELALDLVVNATPPGATTLSRTHLACEENPVLGSSCYARVTFGSCTSSTTAIAWRARRTRH